MNNNKCTSSMVVWFTELKYQTSCHWAGTIYNTALTIYHSSFWVRGHNWNAEKQLKFSDQTMLIFKQHYYIGENIMSYFIITVQNQQDLWGRSLNVLSMICSLELVMPYHCWVIEENHLMGVTVAIQCVKNVHKPGP